MDTTRITDIMRKRREQLGLTCRDLAERIGTDAGTICRYESGERRIRYDRIIPLADALDMDVNELMGWPPHKPMAPDDMDRLIKALKKIGVVRPDGSVDFDRFEQIEPNL